MNHGSVMYALNTRMYFTFAEILKWCYKKKWV